MIKYSTLLLTFLFSTTCFSQWTHFHETDADRFLHMALKNNQLFIGGTSANIYYQANENFEIISLQDHGFINDIQFINGQIGFAGSGCYFSIEDCIGNAIHKTTDGGLTWTLLAQLGSYGVVQEITAITENKIFALTGLHGLFYTNDGGNSWINPTIDENVNQFRQLQFINETTGFIIGRSYQVNVGNYHIIYKTIDGGQTWIPIYSTLEDGFNFWNYHFIDEHTGFFTSDNGIILKTTDGGQTWIPINFTNTTTISGRKIDFVTLDIGYLSAYDNTNKISTLYRTTDAGETWQLELQVNSSTTSEFVFSDIHNGYAIIDSRIIYQRKGTIETMLKPLDVFLYPNPTTDYFKIQPTNLVPNSFQITVLNTLGQLIFSTQELYNPISTTYWETGVYFIEIQDKNGKLLHRGKLIKVEK